MIKYLLLVFLTFTVQARVEQFDAQVVMGDRVMPAAASLLQLNSDSGGLAFSRLTTAQRDAIASGDLIEGITIYNTDTASLDTWNGAGWVGALGGVGGNGTDNCLARWDGTGAPLLQDSGVCVDDSNNALGFASIVVGPGALSTSTVFEVQSTTAGSIPCPKMTEAQRDAIASPVSGQCVFNTDTLAWNQYNGASWELVAGGGGLAKWEASTAYLTDDVVWLVDDNKIYRALSDFTSGGTFTPSNWQELSEQLELLDEDNMASNSATAAPSQQSTKAYVDAGNLNQVDGPVSSIDSNFAFFDGLTGKLLKDLGIASSTDGTLVSNSDSLIPTEQAVKTYADTKITGPASSTDNAIVRYDGTDGKLAQDSLLFLDNNGDLKYTAGSGTGLDIFADTLDASDTGVVTINGGGATDRSRGASLRVYGNEHPSSNAGDISAHLGNVAGSQLRIFCADNTSCLNIDGSTGAATFGKSASSPSNHAFFGNISQLSSTTDVTQSIQTTGAGNSATLDLTVEPGGFDARARFNVNAGQSYTLGIDNSASDAFKISASNSLGTSDVLSISTAGLLDAANLNLNATTSVTSILDEDDMVSDSATALATQQSIKAYVDAQTAAVLPIDLTTDVTGVLPIANGGTGSATQNFVDLTTNQSIAGEKTFSDTVEISESGSANALNISHSGTADAVTINQSGAGLALDIVGDVNVAGDSAQTGAATITGSLAVDNITIDGTTISAATGGGDASLTLQHQAGGNVWRTDGATQVPLGEASNNKNIIPDHSFERGCNLITCTNCTVASVTSFNKTVLANKNACEIEFTANTGSACFPATDATFNGRNLSAKIDVLNASHSGLRLKGYRNGVAVTGIETVLPAGAQPETYYLPSFKGGDTSSQICIEATESITGTFTIDDVVFSPTEGLEFQQAINGEWVNGGENVITATTTAPTKGTVTEDYVGYSRSGDKATIRGAIVQTVAGTTGSGDYLFTLPAGLRFDPSKTIFDTTVYGGGTSWSAGASIGSATITDGTGQGVGLVIPYDATRFRIGFIYTNASVVDRGVFSSTFFTFSNPVRLSFDFDAYIEGWASTNTAVNSTTVQEAGEIYFNGNDSCRTGDVGFGEEISRTDYPELFAKWGERFGAGDGSTTFMTPPRGYFLRIADEGAGNDPDAASRVACNTGGSTGDNVGSCQLDAFQGHWHNLAYQNFGGGAPGAWSIGDGSTGLLSTYVKDPITDGVNGTPRTSSETRAKNIAMRGCIVARTARVVAELTDVVKSPGSSNGKPVEYKLFFGGATDNSSCTSSPCTIKRNTDNFASSVTRAGEGLYTVNVSAGKLLGTFPEDWGCGCESASYTVATGDCSILANTASGSTTTISVSAVNSGGMLKDSQVYLKCEGYRP